MLFLYSLERYGLSLHLSKGTRVEVATIGFRGHEGRHLSTASTKGSLVRDAIPQALSQVKIR